MNVQRAHVARTMSGAACTGSSAGRSTEAAHRLGLDQLRLPDLSRELLLALLERWRCGGELRLARSLDECPRRDPGSSKYARVSLSLRRASRGDTDRASSGDGLSGREALLARRTLLRLERSLSVQGALFGRVGNERVATNNGGRKCSAFIIKDIPLLPRDSPEDEEDEEDVDDESSAGVHTGSRQPMGRAR